MISREKIKNLHNIKAIERFNILKKTPKRQLKNICKLRNIYSKGKNKKQLIEEINKNICIKNAIDVLNKK